MTDQLINEVEDATMLGKQAEKKEERVIEEKRAAKEITTEERKALMEVLYHKKRGDDLGASFVAC